MISQADGQELPSIWEDSSRKIEVIRYYQGKSLKAPTFWWNYMDGHQRRRVLNHLVAVGSLAYNSRAKNLNPGAYKEGVPTNMPLTIGQAGMLYPNPNGGNRMLPSVYAKITGNRWLKANGVVLDISDMHADHIANCINLLKESNGNLVGRSTQILGRMWHHYSNQPDIQAKLEELCILMQKVDVDDMYPVFTYLAEELANKRPLVEYDFETTCMDDALSDWLDTK